MSATPRTDAAAVDLSEDCENPCFWVSDDFARTLERELAAMTDARDYEKAAHQRTRDYYERAHPNEADSLEDAVRRLISGEPTVRLSLACSERLQVEMREAIGPEIDQIRAALRRTLSKLEGLGHGR